MRKLSGKRSHTFSQAVKVEVDNFLLDSQNFMEVLNCDLTNWGILTEFYLDLN